MPSFSFLKFSRGVGEEVGEQKDDLEHNRKAKRRQSRRDYFRSLLHLSSRSRSRSDRRASGQFASAQSPPTPPPRPPMSPIDMQKPLPPPPPGSEPQPEHDPRVKPPPAPIKLTRIMSPLSLADLHKIFSGAPQFFARSEGHYTGAPHPSVAFPWDLDVQIRDLTDHKQIADDAWGCLTAWPHIASHVSRSAEALEKHPKRHKAHFLPRCRERPNMLSMQGLEKGTIGYGAALELGVADALEISDDTLNGDSALIAGHRKKFLNGKDGLRPVTDSTLIDRLVDVSEVYHDDPIKHCRPVVELYTELFTQILFPPSRVTDSEDPYSLQVQVEELVHVLAAPIVWIDFSQVEWRIKLGQILWGPSTEAEEDDNIAINNEVIHESTDQKYWLLLQILLASELLIRLDAISVNMEHGVDPAKAAEIQRFEKDATRSVKWSLILARTWLENIRVEKPTPGNVMEKKPAGWLATLTGSAPSEISVMDGIASLQFSGRYPTRQLDGLLHFSRKIGWPGIETLAAKISLNSIKMSDSAQSTPMGTPLTISTQRSTSYFSNRRPAVRRGLSLHKNLSAIFDPKGWLSNSYLSGLILPGEGLSHFLIATLLENDSAAVATLGEQANLYGGFIYCGKSFWSTACIVGRVLAAGNSSSECMGWISSNVVPRGVGENWVDIDVEYAVLDDPNTKPGKPRLWQKLIVEHDGNVLGGADSSTVLPGDFVLPSDASIEPPISITLESLDLFSAADDSFESTPAGDTPLTEITEPPGIQTYSAMMRFSVQVDEEDEKELNVALTHDIHFVTAHPCIPSPHIDLLRSSASPTSLTFQHSQFSLVAPQTIVKGHPLHKAFTYTTISLATLISTPITTPFSSLLVLPVSTSPPKSADGANSTHSSTHTTNSKISKVLIIDCTTPDESTVEEKAKKPESGHHVKGHHFGSDMEILARALCAERGWNAVISRKGRGCVACAVREAGALGWRIILRVA